MNVLAAAPQVADRKRALMDELVALRTQKAEVLKQIQQIAKRQKTGGVPTQANEVLARNNLLVLQMEQRNRAEKIWLDCGKIVQDLLKNQQTKIYFGEPVKESYVPNYYTVIKAPMDLGTIKSKIDQRRYKTVHEFRDDVRLTFNNCRIFNPPGNHVRVMGDQASERFEKKWHMAAIEFHWDAHVKQCRLEDAQLEAESKSLPDKLREVTAELQELTRKMAAHGQQLAPGPGRVMTFEEKRKLSHSMGGLSGEALVHVLGIIADGPSAPVLNDEDEYELDIDALDPETCWKLQAYVVSVLAAQESKQPGQAPAPLPAAAAAPAAAGGAGGAGAPAGQALLPAAAPGGNGNAQHAAAAAADGAGHSSGSDSDEGVGSKGGAGSTLQADQAAEVKQRPAPGGHDITTFVSATGPGAQTQILKNATQKKDVQLQNAGAWANLTAVPAAAAGAAAQPAAGAPPAAAGADAAPAEDDNLWTEFQGREAQQLQAEEAKKAAEEAERKKKEAEMETMRREAAEAEARKRAEAHAKAEAERTALEEQRQREAQQFQSMAAAAAADKDPDILRGGGHESAANLADLGLQAKDEGSDDEDVPMEDI